MLCPSETSVTLLLLQWYLIELLQSADMRLNAKTHKYSSLLVVSFLAGPTLPGVMAPTEQRGCKERHKDLKSIFYRAKLAYNYDVCKYNTSSKGKQIPDRIETALSHSFTTEPVNILFTLIQQKVTLTHWV